MDKITEVTLDFFDSRKGNFWRWAENGEVAEWQTGTTICYTADLLNILRGYSGRPVPHIGAVILSLLACSDNWNKGTAARQVLHGRLRFSKLYHNKRTIEELDMLLHNAFETLDVINGVTKELRSDSMRIPLLRAIFEDLDETHIAVNDITPIIERFQGIKAQEGIKRFKIDTPIHFLLELEALQNSHWRQKGSLALEQYLMTNLVDTPKPADIAPLPEPESVPLTLMEELLQDDKTEGLAQLTQRLLAAIKIPAHTRGASDQPFGGFSDITNRGNLDRLLISELAQDDDTLTARLVNNESLYLKREEPPSDVERERTILVDTTIQLWGMPRVFALAAALACAEKKQHISQINAFLLRGDDFEILDLTTKKGVIEALGKLDFHLHCGVALREFLLNVRSSATHDIVFVTDAEAFKTLDFQAIFAENKRFLTYLIVVNRAGDLHVFDLSGGRNKSLGTSKFDLKDLLFPKKDPTKRAKTSTFKPIFYEQNPLPLYYLPTGARFSRMHILKHPSVGVVNITHFQRVLRWSSADLGATELLPFIEEGEYCMGFSNIFMVYIVVSNEQTRLFKLYKIHTKKGLDSSYDFTGQAFATVDEMAFHKSCFYLKSGEVIDCISATLEKGRGFDSAFKAYQMEKEDISLKEVKEFIKNRNNPLQSPKTIFINGNKELTIDKFSLGTTGTHFLLFRQTHKGLHPIEKEIELVISTPFKNQDILFHEKKWQDGSIAVIDSRGFLHLKSSNTTIPEITVVLTLDNNIGAWAADGKHFGMPYFLNTEGVEGLPDMYFYKTYIQRFVEHIIEVNKLPF